MKSILIVEDDMDLAFGIKDIVSNCGYEVFMVHSVKDARIQLRNRPIDLCILDIRLPDGNGYDLCRKIRGFYQGAVIMLTACSSTEEIVEGLMAGADDYVTKPFQITELLARIEAQFRRILWKEVEVPGTVFSGDLKIELNQHHIYKLEELLDLSIREYTVCELLLEYGGRIVTRKVMLEKIWDSRENFVEEGTLNVHISRIRKKLGSYNGISYIETIKGFGYRWAHQIIRN